MMARAASLAARSVFATALIALGLAALAACDGAEPIAPGAMGLEQNGDALDMADLTTAAHPARPFRGRFTGTMHVLGFCADGAGVVAGLNGTGTATHLGAATTSTTACASMVPGGGFYGEVAVTLTAANGDEITLSLTGSGVNPDGWELNEFEVVGGTGRFVAATGDVTQRVRLTAPPAPPEPGTWVSTLEGWIAY